MPALQVQPIVRNHTGFSGDKGLYTQTFAVAMNKAAYAKLPADLKKVIDASSGIEAAALFGRAMEEGDAAGLGLAQKAGNNIITLDAAETQRWQRAGAGTRAVWYREVSQKGIDGQKLAAEAEALIAKHSKRSAERSALPGGPRPPGPVARPCRHTVVDADAPMPAVWLLLVWRMRIAMGDYRENGAVIYAILAEQNIAKMFAAAFVPGLLTWRRGGLSGPTLREAFESTAAGTAMVLLIVLGAAAYDTFLALSQMPQELADWVGDQGFGPYTVLLAILLFYLVFGCVMDSLSMILLTIPIFFPMVSGLDFGLTPEETAIWLGALVLIVVEVGLITPPVGMNLFVIQSMAPDISMRDTYRGVLPFVASDLARVVVPVLFPAITRFVLRL